MCWRSRSRYAQDKHLLDHAHCSYFLKDCYQDSVAVTVVWGKLSEEGEPFFWRLACLRKELKFSALNYLWLCCCSSNVSETIPVGGVK